MKQSNQCARLMSLGLSKTESTQIMSTIAKWCECNGDEWTASRLKEIKQAYLHRLAGDAYYLRGKWIAYHKEDGTPKGPFRTIFKMSSKRKLTKALTALTSYSSLVAHEVTEKQKEKFFGSMESLSRKGLDSSPRINFRVVRREPCPPPTIMEYCVGNTNAPAPFGRSRPEREIVPTLAHAACSMGVRRILQRYQEHFDKVYPVSVLSRYEPSPSDVWKSPDHAIGRISVIQEPGMKARFIANPNRIIQAGLEPLKRDLDSYLKGLPTDCTHDQLAGVKAVQGWLREGRTVHSVDLSDATNTFPWNYQKETLRSHFRSRGHETLISIMDQCVQSGWETTLKSGSREMVHFQRGQPLGLGPSFHTFALSHNLLLAGICKKVGVKPESCYRVLGDDVVIAHDKVASTYRSTLQNLGCKVSLNKTFTSKTMAEFAGYTITSHCYGKGYKWRHVSDQNFVEALKGLGPSALGFFDKPQREVGKFLLKGHMSIGGASRQPGELDDLFAAALGAKKLGLEEPLVTFRDLCHDATKLLHSGMHLDSHPAIEVAPNRCGRIITTCLQTADGDSFTLYGKVRSVDINELNKLDVPEIWPNPRLVESFQAQKKLSRPVPQRGVLPKSLLQKGQSIGMYQMTRASGDPRPNPLAGLATIRSLLPPEKVSGKLEHAFKILEDRSLRQSKSKKRTAKSPRLRL